MRFAHALLLGVLSISLFTRSTQATPQDVEGWFSAISHVSLDHAKKYQLYLELQPRLGDNWQRAAAVLMRGAIAYRITPSLSSYGGYAWFPTFYDTSYHRDYRDEQRLWQQLFFKHEWLGISWHHRVRQEQRKIERTDGVSHRTRYFLRGSYALSEERDFGLTAYDEFMVNLTSVEGGPWSGYDRNRIFLGPYWEIGTTRYEIGYLGEHAKRFGSDERWVHALLVLASYNF